jgi:hypothetical protein
MATYFIKNDIVQGSAKVQGYVKNIDAIAISDFTVSNNPLPGRTDNRSQGKNPDFGSIFWQGQLGKDTVTSLQALGQGTNIKKVDIVKVQSDGTNNVEELKYTLGQLNGATYVKFWSLFYDDTESPDTGNKILYTAEVVTNGIEIESNAVDQSQQAQGKVTAGLSRLNNQVVS